MPSVLIVDDEANIRRMVGALLTAEGYDVLDAPDARAGLALAEAQDPDLVLVDLMMPGDVDGLGLLERLRQRRPDTPVIMMSGRASLGDAVHATRLGAFTFLEKPLTPEGVLLAIGSALELRQARRAARALREDLGLSAEMVGDSPAMRAVRQLIAQVGPTDARVLVTGESGTGKELVAAALHAASPRRDLPFVRVNCAAIPRDLVESEMFGHERGAFTGATERRIGRFELAHTGTLFLDEVGDLGLEAQAKLLRAIEAREIERVGGGKPVRVDVRIIAATNKDLGRAVREGAFREDLFFRLNVIPIELPPLRERPGDLPLLVRHLAERHRARTGQACSAWSPDVLEAFACYRWPGNVRELANIVERLSILHPGGTVSAAQVRRLLPDAATPASAPAITPEAATPEMASAEAASAETVFPMAAHPSEAGSPTPADHSLADALDAYERHLIGAALGAAGGNVAEAARRLQTDRPNLYRRMRRLGLLLLGALLLPAGRGATATLHAQPRGEPRYGAPPEAVRARALAIWNAGLARTARGRVVIAAGDTVASTLAVLEGPLVLAGVVRGDVLAINADVRLDSTAWVQGALLVVGGALQGATRGRVDGDVQVWRSALPVRLDADSLVLAAGSSLTTRLAEWRTRQRASGRDFVVRSGHTYNRVEGLPILAGPRLRLQGGDTRLSAEALGIFRTGDRLAWERENLGHRLRAELRRGDDARHLAVGARHIDEVDAVESWALRDAEVGLATLLVGRDYRDYFNRAGGHGYVRAAGPLGSELTVEVGRERWRSREARAPLALFRGDRAWRANPAALEGSARLVTARATIDTRNDPERPLDGWFVRAEYEHGRVDVTRGADSTRLDLTLGALTYGRFFVDARRYNRLAPNASVNLRVVAGGLAHGDGLPAQRRLSLAGVDGLPGYAFRAPLGSPDVGTCTRLGAAEFAALGQPAGCDRLLLVQAEWAGDFRLALFGRAPRTDDRRWYAEGLRADGRWVVFVNSGRGWLVGPRDDGLSLPRGTAPLFLDFRTDVGVGLDVGAIGAYVAQPLSGGGGTPRVFVRVGRRF